LLSKERGKRLDFIIGQALCHDHLWILPLPIAELLQLGAKF